MRARPFNKIVKDLAKAIIKKLRKDKLFVLKFILYTAYAFLSAKKALTCLRLLFTQLRKKNQSLSLNILSILYLGFIFVQLFIIYTSEASVIYRKVKLSLKLICYEITFENRI